ncbi:MULTISPECIES: VanZ family protein [Streptomycetaceae]|uniref:VanZ family protein n=1 Tax=Streptomycetaceae TaxID=2062 RepID=UPI00093FE2F6|nr:VanZ family protein [Streptomyces sp. CB02056]OKI00565.1 hypothetical protein AMK13_33390 [Streptomyces sp. CB02056]
MWKIALHVNVMTVTIGMLAALACAFASAIALRKNRRLMVRISQVATVIASAVILYITLRPQGGWGNIGHSGRSLNLTPAAFLDDAAQPHSLAWEEPILNAAMMLPLGVVAFTGFSRRLFGLGFGFALSVAIESVQWPTKSGRSSDIMDVAGNTAGYLLGVALLLAAHRILSLGTANRTQQKDRDGTTVTR